LRSQKGQGQQAYKPCHGFEETPINVLMSDDLVFVGQMLGPGPLINSYESHIVLTQKSPGRGELKSQWLFQNVVYAGEYFFARATLSACTLSVCCALMRHVKFISVRSHHLLDTCCATQPVFFPCQPDSSH
jgi:hypothetical protein